MSNKAMSCLAVACLFFTAGVVAGESSEAPPNIILIVIDTLRFDHVGCNGYKRDTTPNLNRVANAGARCEQMIASSSWTLPSVMTMFTSLPPALHRVTAYNRKLGDDATTLAAELKKSGYQTAGVTSNPGASAQYGFGKGFDLYDDYTLSLASDLNLFEEKARPHSIRGANTSPMVNRIASAWLKDKRDAKRPFFLFMLYLDPHADYTPPAPYDRSFDAEYKGPVDGKNMYEQHGKGYTDADREHSKALYDGEIRHVDAHVGKMLQLLDDLKLSDNTLLIITADHGEEFWDHGSMFHGHTLFDELVHVPFIARWPGRIPAGTVVKPQLGLIGLMPTILDAAKAKTPPQCQGAGYLNALLGKATAPEQVVFLETDVDGVDLKAIRTPTGKVVLDQKAGKRQAFHLKDDPRETADQHTVNPAWLGDASRRLDEWLKLIEQTAGKSETQKMQPDDKLLEHLKQMGYVQ